MRIYIDHGVEWKDPYRGWAMKWINSNYWKVARYFGSREDAVQECALLYMRVVRHYSGKPLARAHLMALYKTTVFRAWMHYAKSDTKLEDIELFEGTDYAVDRLLALPDQTLYAALCAASWQLQFVLEVIAQAPAELLQLMLAPGPKAKMNKRWKEAAKLRTHKDLVGELRRVLKV